MDADALGRLVARHLDGNATPEENAALDAAVRSDTQAARLLARAVLLDADLRQVHRATPVSTRDPGSITGRIAVAEQAAAARSARRRRPALRRRGVPTVWRWAIAAGLLAALTALLWPSAGAPFRQVGQPLAAGTALSGTVELAGGGSVALDAGSVAVAAGTARAPRLELHAGVARCTVASRAGVPPFVVTTPHGEVRVLGTAFAVAVDADTRVAVERGVVEVAAQGATRRLAAGASARLAADAPPAVFGAVAQVARTAAPTDWDISSAGTAVTAAGSGPTGAPAQRLRFTGQHQPWVGVFWLRDLPDWSRATGISLVLCTPGTGSRLRFDLVDECPPDQPRNWRDSERFTATVPDDAPGWREVRIPFTAFKRLAELPAAAPDNGLNLTAVRGFRLVLVGGGEILVERIGVYTGP